MQLDIEKTKIDVTEELVYENSYSEAALKPIATVYNAELDGKSTEGHHISMTRQATTPDAAIKALFEAMTEVGVTL